MCTYPKKKSGKIYINENQINLKTSWLSLKALELQGIITTFFAFILCILLYLLIKKINRPIALMLFQPLQYHYQKLF